MYPEEKPLMNSCFLLSRPGYERRFEIRESEEICESGPADLNLTKSVGNDPIPFLLPVIENESESDYESEIELDDKAVNTDFPHSAFGIYTKNNSSSELTRSQLFFGKYFSFFFQIEMTAKDFTKMFLWRETINKFQL